jgi:3-oxoacyl-[acyl-carrier protein] reductase
VRAGQSAARWLVVRARRSESLPRGQEPRKVDALAKEIRTEGKAAEAAEVDALDEQAVKRHADNIIEKDGSIDISFNLIAVPHVQGTELVDLPMEDFAIPVMNITKTHLLTARSAARHMVKKGSGVILMMTTTPDRRAIPLLVHSG